MQSHHWFMAPDGNGHLLECSYCGALAIMVIEDIRRPPKTVACFAGMQTDGLTEWFQSRPVPTIPWYCHDTTHIWELEQIKQVMDS